MKTNTDAINFEESLELERKQRERTRMHEFKTISRRLAKIHPDDRIAVLRSLCALNGVPE